MYGFLIVISGKIRIFKLSPTGREMVLAKSLVYHGEATPDFGPSSTSPEKRRRHKSRTSRKTRQNPSGAGVGVGHCARDRFAQPQPTPGRRIPRSRWPRHHQRPNRIEARAGRLRMTCRICLQRSILVTLVTAQSPPFPDTISGQGGPSCLMRGPSLRRFLGLATITFDKEGLLLCRKEE